MTRISFFLVAALLAVACTAPKRAQPTEAAGVARAFLAIEGEAHYGRVAEACEAARALIREGWDEAAEAARDESRLVLAAEVYRHAAGSLHCLEATMMTGAAIQRGWLPAKEPQAAARQYFRTVAFVFHDEDPPTDNGEVGTAEVLLRQLQTITNLPSALFEPAAAGVLGERNWAARMHGASLKTRYEEAMRSYFGVGRAHTPLLAQQLSSSLSFRDDAASDKRRRALLYMTVGSEDSERAMAIDYLRLAATDGDPIAAAQLGEELIALGQNKEALSWMLVAAVLGGPLNLETIKDLERALSKQQIIEARGAADARLYSAAAKQ